MKKDIFYKVIILFLLLLNLAVLILLWTREPGRPGHGPAEIDRLIISRLKLDQNQVAAFGVLKQEHHSHMMELDEESANLHRQFFNILKKEPPDTALRNNLLLKLEDNTREKELATFDHFHKLRSILRPNQKPLFDDFVQELGKHLMMPPPPGEHGPPEQ